MRSAPVGPIGRGPAVAGRRKKLRGGPQVAQNCLRYGNERVLRRGTWQRGGVLGHVGSEGQGDGPIWETYTLVSRGVESYFIDMKKLLVGTITAFLVACAGASPSLPMPSDYFLLCAHNQTNGKVVDVRVFGRSRTKLKTFHDLSVNESDCSRVSFADVRGVITAAFQGQGTRWYVPDATRKVFIGSARGALVTAAQEGSTPFAHSWIDPY